MRKLFVCSPAALALAVLLWPAAAAAWCVVGVSSWDTLSMRSGPGIFYPVRATIAPNACGIRVVGACSAGWCRVSFRGRTGWSNTFFMASEAGPGMQRDMARVRVAATNRAPARRGAATRSVHRAAHAPISLPHEPAADRAAERTEPDTRTTVAPARPAVPEPVPAERTPAPSPPGPREVCVSGIPKGDTLKVRAGPSTSAALRYGFLPETCGVRVTGDCKDGWCPVEYRTFRGWAEERNLR